MKKLLRSFVALALISAPLAGSAVITLGSAVWTEAQALTRSPADPNSDTTPATSGLSLAGVTGYRVIASAPSGKTITGGSALCWYYSPTTSRWARCATSLDFTPATGARDAVSVDFRVSAPYGRVLYAASSITESGGGAAVTFTIEARKDP